MLLDNRVCEQLAQSLTIEIFIAFHCV